MGEIVKRAGLVVARRKRRRSIVRWEGEAGAGANQVAGLLQFSDRLDESQPVIPRRVALQQSPPPLHQPIASSTLSAENVNCNRVDENEKVSGMCPSAQMLCLFAFFGQAKCHSGAIFVKP
jgi:hypothetical protein